MLAYDRESAARRSIPETTFRVETETDLFGIAGSARMACSLMKRFDETLVCYKAKFYIAYFGGVCMEMKLTVDSIIEAVSAGMLFLSRVEYWRYHQRLKPHSSAGHKKIRPDPDWPPLQKSVSRETV